MTEPASPQTGEGKAPTQLHSEVTVNQTIINQQIVINPSRSTHAGPDHTAHHHEHRSNRPHPPAHNGAVPTQKNSVTPPGLAPEVSYAEDGDKMTRYTAHDGSSALYREDRQNNGAVTVVLHDASGTLTTHGDRRGYEQSRVDLLGNISQESISVDTYKRWPTSWGGSLDRTNCPNSQHNVNIVPAITGDVTRDKLQQFGDTHPELRDTLKHVALPVTLSGGHQINFGEALAQPSEFRACPPHAYAGVQRK